MKPGRRKIPHPILSQREGEEKRLPPRGKGSKEQPTPSGRGLGEGDEDWVRASPVPPAWRSSRLRTMPCDRYDTSGRQSNAAEISENAAHPRRGALDRAPPRVSSISRTLPRWRRGSGGRARSDARGRRRAGREVSRSVRGRAPASAAGWHPRHESSPSRSAMPRQSEVQARDLGEFTSGRTTARGGNAMFNLLIAHL